MRFLKRLARATLASAAACALALAACAAVLARDGYAFFLLSADRGAVLGTFEGVAVYAPGEYDVRGTYGLEYQCVELANRAYVQKLGFRNLAKTGDADSYFWDAAGKGLAAYENGGSEPPRAWDLLVFDGGPNDGSPGHVAVVTEVDADAGSVSFLEQNFRECVLSGLFCKETWRDTLPLVREDGGWRVAQGKYPHPVAGWSRPKELP